MQKQYLTLKEFSSYSGLSKGSLHRLIAQKKIKYSKPNGKLVFVHIDDVHEFLTRNTTEREVHNG